MAKILAPASEDLSTHRPINVIDYDNLDEPTYSYQYDGDQKAITATTEEGGTAAGVPTLPPLISSSLRAESFNLYDERGRAYRSSIYSVNQSTGALSSNTLDANTWYDRRGNVLKVSNRGGLVDKYVYDGAGRITKVFHHRRWRRPRAGRGEQLDHADDVSGDNVLDQRDNFYDANGNVTFTAHRLHFHDDTNTGELYFPGIGAPFAKARVYYAENYYDAADRLTDSVDLGALADTLYYDRPDPTVPTRSDTKHVTSYTYDFAGHNDTSPIHEDW